MITVCNQFEIILNTARSFGGFEEITSTADVAVWEAIASSYQKHEVTSNSGEVLAEITIDWIPAVEYARKCKSLYTQPIEKWEKILGENPDFFQRSVICSAYITFESKRANCSPSAGKDFLQQLLYEIYLVANLSVPGSFNLFKSYIRAKGAETDKDPFSQTELKLSEFLFENSWHCSQERPFIQVGFLPFEDVFTWYKRLNVGLKQVAKETAEKALFTLLHLGRTSFLEPEATLWIARALEALYETSPGGSFQLLHRRISVLFGFDDQQQTTIKKQLREFYNVRNSFAHGGGSICHPMANERWDPLVDKVFGRTIDANSIAAAILVGSVQKLIRHKAVSLIFNEQVLFIRAGDSC